MRIAVIGSGVSGLVSAYLLAPHHEVVMYERSSRIGGHAHTLYVKENNKKIAVDNGFMVYNPEQYPNFIKLLEVLGVQSTDTEMSFSVSIQDRIAYRGDIPFGLFAQKKNIFNVRFWRLLFQIVRLRTVAKKILNEHLHDEDTLNDFIRRYGFHQDLGDWFLFPMLSAIWSMKDSDRVGDFPALATFTFLNNHKLLDNAQPTWKTIAGGSIKYVSKIEQYLKDHGVRILTNTLITSVTRDSSSVTIKVGKKAEVFDYVLFATHADTTKTLLTDISTAEERALSKFTYSKNTTVLHKDTRMVSPDPKLLASWNFIQTANSNSTYSRAMFTYCMYKLQHIPMETPVFVTLNPHSPIDTKNIYAIEEYTHPEYNLATLSGQQDIESLQGKRRTLFAGAYLGYGFHEDGVVSAINAVKKFGIEPPWNQT